jgi:ribosomal protein S9
LFVVCFCPQEADGSPRPAAGHLYARLMRCGNGLRTGRGRSCPWTCFPATALSLLARRGRRVPELPGELIAPIRQQGNQLRADPDVATSDGVWLVKTDANGNVAGGSYTGQMQGTTTEQAGALTAKKASFRTATPANGPAATADSRHGQSRDPVLLLTRARTPAGQATGGSGGSPRPGRSPRHRQ